MIKFKWETEFKQTEIGELPQEWKLDDIDSYLSEIIDYRGKTPKKSAFGIITLSAKSIKNGKIDYSKVYFISEETFKKWERRGKPKVGDVLLTTEGPLGEVAQLDRENVAVSQRLLVLRGKKGLLDNTYLKYYLMSPIGQHELLSRATGTTVEGIRQSEFRQIFVVLPSFSEQCRIAAVLSWFDDLIENKKRQNEILEKVAMAIFKSWFVDFEPFKDEEFVYSEELGKEIPMGWEVKAIGEVVDILYGRGLPESKRKNGSFPVVGSSGIVGYHAQFLATPPSIVIGRKGNAGSVYLMLEPFYPIDTVFYTGKTTPAITFYIYHHLKLTPLAEIGMTDTAVPGININNLKAVKIPIPPQPILQHFHSLVEPLFQKIIFNQRQIMVLRKIRDALLPKLVFGRLRVEEV